MSTTLSFIGKEITIYCGIPVLVLGVLGCLLNILVFLSLQTFRQSSCAFYLTIMSVCNIGQLFYGLFVRIMNTLTNTDSTVTSLFYCKSRLYLIQVFIGTSMTCFCLATIDQYFATCTRPRFQQWCNIRLAQRIVIISIIIWILHGIPYIVFFDQVVTPTTNQITCIDTNYIFEQYRVFCTLLLLIGYLPIIIAGLFGSMAFHNVQQLAYRTIPLVRRELDKQLTVMVLVQVFVNIFSLLPYTTVFAVQTSTSVTNDPVSKANLQFVSTITFVTYHTFFAVSVRSSEFKFLFNCIILESILHLYLCIGTFS